ncbi:LuxR C-terminal-related transcriptional regulator [Mycobacterium avium]|uniref:LuxR C-terminal-related transcriptional regulator n=1 Tax=Mycobacterium avium TaxID=1764 RepID=UPI000A02BDC4|nr:LuxR C-terminal-related transcriptional regulator [Mycobacterium avium]
MAELPATVTQCAEQASELLRETAEVLGVEEICRMPVDTDLHGVDAALLAARLGLTRHLELAALSPRRHPDHVVAALMLRLQLTQLSIKDAILAEHRDEVCGAREAVNRLRGAVSAADLAERIPVEAHRMGFTRVLFSRIRQGTWFACSAFAGADEELARRMVSVGLANPRRLSCPLLESEMVRRGVPILVRDAQSNPHVHPELVALTKTTTYVAAPVFSWGKPIAFLHADRDTDESGVQPFDRDVLGMFAEGLGVAFERNLMVDRLQAMRRAADDHLRAANTLADEFTLEVMDLAEPATKPIERLLSVESAQPMTEHHDREVSGALTAREADVLRGLAAGKTNAQIAVSLVVTEGTIKTHVKHVLRKLGAANRTEAVARYHRMRNSSRDVSPTAGFRP